MVLCRLIPFALAADALGFCSDTVLVVVLGFISHKRLDRSCTYGSLKEKEFLF